MSKLKIAGYLLAVLALLGVGYKLAPSPVAQTKTVYVDRVVVQEKVVTKDVVRTETRPDGTKIVTESKSNSVTHTDVKETKKESTVRSAPTLPKYSLGISYRPDSLLFTTGVYTAELSRRLWNTSIWATAAVTTKAEVAVGLRLEW